MTKVILENKDIEKIKGLTNGEAFVLADHENGEPIFVVCREGKILKLFQFWSPDHEEGEPEE